MNTRPSLFRSEPRPFSVSGSPLLPSLALAAALGWVTSLPAAQNTPPPAAGAEPAAAAETANENYAPVEYGIDRYQKLRGKSPFEFELAKPPAPETADPFADIVLAGFAGSHNNPTVYLLNTKTQERITILGAGSKVKNDTGFKVISVNRGRTLSTTTATIEKDGREQELAFDPKNLSSMTGGAAGGGAAPGKPGVPGQVQPNGQPVVRPNLPTAAAKPYQAPQAFIPSSNGQGNRNPGQPPNQAPALGGVAGGGGGGVDAQQQVNGLLNNAGAQPNGIQPAVMPAANINGTAAGAPQPRRRVVLPTTP